MDPKSVVGGFEYACVFTCDHSRHVWVYLMREKSHTFRVFKKFKALAKNLTGHKMKFFHSDRGGEFMSHEFTEYLEQEGIIHKTSVPRTPQQNGTTECMNQTILGGARTMLHHAGMTQEFWSEAVHVAAHILIHSPRSGLDWKTPYELLFRRKPEVTHIRVFGCRTWAIDDKAKKWDLRSTPMVFVGYEIASKAYWLWNPKTHKIVVSANVKFDETVLPNKPSITPAPVVTTTTPIYVPPHKHATTVDIPRLFVNEEKAKPSTASTSKGKQRVISPPSSSSSSSSESVELGKFNLPLWHAPYGRIV